MCDTFVHVPDNPGEPVIFGKNSDREPNEAQQIVRYAAGRRPSGRVSATYLEVECPAHVHEVVLSKPFQMWGAEMGVNDCGVAIGNEAVFTRIKIPRRNDGLTGMDLLRLALEQSATAEEALHTLIRYLETYGQDACGGYRDRNFYYHNSFIIADSRSAFVLETAGRYWAWKRVTGYRAISNGLSIGSDYDAISPGAVDYAVKRRWAGKGDFSFSRAFSAFWMPRLAACQARRSLSEARGNAVADWSAARTFSILRSHAAEPFHPAHGKTDSLCMHASGLLCPSQTTGSMVAVLRPGAPATVWLTGSAAPCLSLFKPFYLGSDVLEEVNFPAPSAFPDASYWWQWEAFHRRALPVYREVIETVRLQQSAAEAGWLERDAETVSGNREQRSALSRECLGESLNLLREWQVLAESASPAGHWLYRRYWSRLSKAVARPSRQPS